MSACLWVTGTPLDPGFEREWSEAIARAPDAHFAFRLDVLAWQHARGMPALAVRVDTPGVRGVIVARLERGTWVSGLPWRWMAAVEGEARDPSSLMRPEEAAVLFAALCEAAGERRVRAFLPAAPDGRAPGFLAGKTLLHRVDVSDEELIRAMDKTKRAMIRRAGREGYAVAEGATLEQFRKFARVQRETDRRHGNAPLDGDGDLPASGERWREWELPWMWLLLAEREGEVGSGLGFALGPGRVIESRAAASTQAALKSGAFVLVAYEAARRARERGLRYLDWGGDTFFKRDITGPLGARVPLHCWLGGDARWSLTNHSEVLAWRARRGAAGLAHALRGRKREAS